MTKSKRIKELEEKVKELENRNDLIDFLCKHNKDEVILENVWLEYQWVKALKYIYNCTLETVYVGNAWSYECEIVVNNKTSAILRDDNKYYKLEKYNAKLTDITDIYEPKKETKSKKENN